MAEDEADPIADLTDRSAFADWTRAIIRYSDLDPNGHVNNGAINQYFEDGRVHFRRGRMTELGRDMLAGVAIVRFDATYRAALLFPGEVEIGTAVLRIGRSSFDLGQAVFQGETCIATARVVAVFIDPAANRSVPVPDEVRAILEAAMADTA